MRPGWMQLKMMKAMVEGTAAEEIDCGSCYDQLDEFCEHVLNGKSAAEMIPLVQEHLDRCGDCREEFGLLLKALKGGTDRGI
jgi:hypothetical protein